MIIVGQCLEVVYSKSSVKTANVYKKDVLSQVVAFNQ